jgi:hypothetical protein
MDKKGLLIGGVIGIALGILIADTIQKMTKPKNFWQKFLVVFCGK